MQTNKNAVDMLITLFNFNACVMAQNYFWFVCEFTNQFVYFPMFQIAIMNLGHQKITI